RRKIHAPESIRGSAPLALRAPNGSPRWGRLCRRSTSTTRSFPFDRDLVSTGTRRTSMIARMRILLLSMPDSFEHTPVLAVRMPNGALASLAGNVDAHHRVAVADLLLSQSA